MDAPATDPRATGRRAGRWAVLLVALLALCCAGFVALGLWQWQRLAWKTALIARVEQRMQAPAVAPPAPATWDDLRREDHDYLRVRLEGRWSGPVLWVRAGTELGWGYWAMRALETSDGWMLVNRGFVLAEQREALQPRLAAEAGQPAAVLGLLRLSETPSWFRPNDATAGRWAARDVPAMAAALGLGSPTHPGRVAPFYVDAWSVAGAAQGDWPRAGLTVVQFSNNHLSYALTWFALALLSAGGVFLVARPRFQDTR
jgi:surfeit locus 1 family protein